MKEDCACRIFVDSLLTVLGRESSAFLFFAGLCPIVVILFLNDLSIKLLSDAEKFISVLCFIVFTYNIFIDVVYRFLENYTLIGEKENEDKSTRSIPPIMMGGFERFFLFSFSYLLSYDHKLSEAGDQSISAGYSVLTLAGVWIAAKMASNWQRRKYEKDDPDSGVSLIRRSQVALICSAISCLSAVFAGSLAGAW